MEEKLARVCNVVVCRYVSLCIVTCCYVSLRYVQTSGERMDISYYNRRTKKLRLVLSCRFHKQGQRHVDQDSVRPLAWKGRQSQN